MAFTDSKGFVHAGKKPRRRPRKQMAKTGGKKFKKAVKTIVKKELAKEAETKFIIEDVLPPTGALFNSQVNSSADWYRCLPLLYEGDSSQQRIGNKISPRSCIGRWAVSFENGDVLTRDVTVVLYVLQPRYVKTYNSTVANNQLALGNATFLRTGSSPFGCPFNGDWLTSVRPVDTLAHTVIGIRKFRLNKASGNFNGSGVIDSYRGDGTGMYSVGSAEFRKEIKMRIPLPKQLRYSGPNQIIPENASPIWALGYYYNDNTAADTSAGLLRVQYTVQMYYDDI